MLPFFIILTLNLLKCIKMNYSRIKSQTQKNLDNNNFKKDFFWVKRQFEKGRLKVYGHGGPNEFMSDNAFKSLTELIKNTVDIYDDNWDINFRVEISADRKKIYFYLTDITIFFPPFYISTGPNGDSHLITDLYVKYVLKYYNLGERLIVDDIKGTRASATTAEIDSKYVHSHLNTWTYGLHDGGNTTFPRWASFCTGSGHINDIRADLNSQRVFQEANVIALLIQTQGLVSHESSAGGPYIYIHQISEAEDSSSERYFYQENPSSIIALLKTIFSSRRHLRDRASNPYLLDINEINGSFEVQDTKALDTFFQNHSSIINNSSFRERLLWWVPKYNGLPSSDISTYKHISYVGSSVLQEPDRDEVQIPGLMMFKGEVVTFKHIRKEEKQEISESLGEMDFVSANYQYEDYTIPPQYRQIILKYLTNELNKKTIRQSTLDRYKN